MRRWDPGTLCLYQSSFKWILLPYNRLNYQNPPPPPPSPSQNSRFPETIEVTNTVQPTQNRFDFIIFLSGNSRYGFPSLDKNLQPIDQFGWKWYPILDLNSLIYIPYSRLNCLKSIPFAAAHTNISHIWQYPPPLPPGVIPIPLALLVV